MKNLINILLGVLLGVLIWNTSIFQETFYHEKYWNKKIDRASALVGYDKYKIIDTREKIRLYKSIELLEIQKIELKLLHEELQRWETSIKSDQERLDLLIKKSTE